MKQDKFLLWTLALVLTGSVPVALAAEHGGTSDAPAASSAPAAPVAQPMKPKAAAKPKPAAKPKAWKPARQAKPKATAPAKEHGGMTPAAGK